MRAGKIGGSPKRKVAWTLITFAFGVTVGLVVSQLRTGVSPEASAPTTERPDAVATVDGATITVADFEAEIARRGGASFQTAEARRALLDEMIRLEVLAAQARRAGYESEHALRSDMKHLLAGRYRENHLEPQLRAITVDAEEIESVYHDEAERFTIPAAARTAMIRFAWTATTSPDGRQRIRERAAAAREAALRQSGSQDFGALAAQHSDDQASRYRGGDLGWLVTGQPDGRLEAPVLAAIAALEPGAVSDLIETDSGLYLIKVLDTREAELRPLAAVADEIRAQIQARKVAEATAQFHTEAATGLSIRVDEERFAAIEPPGKEIVETQRQPPPLPQI